VFLTSCTGRLETFGFENLKEESKSLIVKEDTKQSTLQKFNTPSAQSTDKTRWYYVYFEKEFVAFLPGKIANDTLLKLIFDKDGLLIKKELVDNFLKKQNMHDYTTPIERSTKNDNYIVEILENIAHTSEDGDG